MHLRNVSKEERRAFFRDPDTLYIFWMYYYPEGFKCELADFHWDWIEAIANTDKHIMNESFRSSLKTEITKIYVIKSICYNVWKYIVVQSYDSAGSDEMVANISRMLVKESLVEDYGQLYPFSAKKSDFSKKSVTHFDTTNGVKIKAKALLEQMRGSNIYNEDEGTSRPDLIILDDIDTTDSVRNKDIIDKNDVKLRQQTIGAMAKGNSRIIFLGNTIGMDGLVRRFAEMAKVNSRWVYFRQPIYDDIGECVWPQFFTPDVIENIKATEGDAWDQNYLLIPKLTIGTTVFDCKQPIKVVKPYKILEGFHLFQPPQDKLVIGVDIAEGGEKGDNSTLKCRNKKGQSVFEFA